MRVPVRVRVLAGEGAWFRHFLKVVGEVLVCATSSINKGNKGCSLSYPLPFVRSL